MKTHPFVEFFKSRLAGHLILMTSGNILCAGLAFLAILIISKAVSVSDFGLFNISISVILMAQPLISFGMLGTMIKFVSSHLARGQEDEAVHVVKAVFIIKATLSLILAAFVFFTAGPLAQHVFRLPSLFPVLRMAAFGIFFLSIFNYVKATLWAYKKYPAYVVIQFLTDMAKVLTISILFLISALTAFSAVSVFSLLSILGIVLGFLYFRAIFFSKGNHTNKLYFQLFSFGKWLFLSNLGRRLFLYVGVVMLARMLDSEAAGIYGLALNLTYIFLIIVSTLTAVLLPEVSRFRDKEQFIVYFRQSLKICAGIGILLVLFLFFAKDIILFFFGERYLGSIPVFIWLALGFLFFALFQILRPILLALDKPHIVAYVDLVSVVVMIVGCYFLIPHLGVLAPAITAFVLNVFAVLVLAFYTHRQIHKADVFIEPEKLSLDASGL
ncbi:MAG: oligosaccharide flippase family protein [Candidatus Aminicenantaceae bacterium]